jgi:2-polyprenyl-6-hydroxyphenyl methylase/3-demethylubiquinone-9 3-methyltransferase
MVSALTRPVNNAFYDTLGDRWYAAGDDPVALLRAESRSRNPWVLERILATVGPTARILDVGCGAGFLSNHLARAGLEVHGLDASRESLAVAERHDETRSVRYQSGDALSLPYADASFDVVCAMDFLEHVEAPDRVVAEAARVLRPNGLFFFHTFNRNWLSWLVVIKGLEWFVKNTPPDLHVLRLFLKPREVRKFCENVGLEVLALHGSAPVVVSRAFWRMLFTGVVPEDFRFRFTRSTLTGYTGYASRRELHASAQADSSRNAT